MSILDEGTFMGMYSCMPNTAILALFLSFSLLWGFYLLDAASWFMVKMLAKLIALVCLVQALSKALVDGCLWLPSATNAAPPAPFLANSLSLPYFRYASI